MQRPKEFDERVMAYMPKIKKMIARVTPPAERADLVQDALMHIFDKWENFRPIREEDPYGDRSGFFNWIWWQVRSVISNKNVKAQLRTVDIEDVPSFRMSTPPRQESIVYANQVCRRLSRSRGGRMLLRIGKGEQSKDIGKKRGISGERVRQLTEKARADLVKRVAA